MGAAPRVFDGSPSNSWKSWNYSGGSRPVSLNAIPVVSVVPGAALVIPEAIPVVPHSGGSRELLRRFLLFPELVWWVFRGPQAHSGCP